MPKRLVFVTLLALIFTLICSQRHAGFFVLMFSPFFLLWAVIKAAIIFKNKASWINHLELVGVWVTAIIVVSSIHVTRSVVARRAANEVVDNIFAYKDKHGVYPPELSDGLLPNELVYSAKNSKPQLFYMSTFMPFSGYIYDFEMRRWTYQGD